MNSILQAFRPIARVFAIRRKRRPRETGGSPSHPNPPTTDSPESRLLSDAGDAIELVSPMIQAVAGVIPVAGTPLKAAIDGLLYIIQIIDVGPLQLLCFAEFLLIAFQTTKRNKADLDDLASRVSRLSEFILLEPQARNEVETRRRTALAQCVFKSFSISNDKACSDVSKTPRAN